MIDLSNNNRGPVLFGLVRAAGHRRVYHKVTEGTGFVDRDYLPRRRAAQRWRLKVGGYHFAHPHTNSPEEEVSFFLRHLDLHGCQLRPALDIEEGGSSRLVGRWAVAFCNLFARRTGIRPLVYSYTSYLDEMRLEVPPGELWLASFGRNDGAEHTSFRTPRPWRVTAAHQYTSNKRVPGVRGRCDASRVLVPGALDLRPGR